MARVSSLVLAAAASLALTGCASLGRENCHEPQDYQSARSVPSLQIPEGLSAPQTRGALKIPEVGETARKRGPDEPCLDEPPSFYPGRPKPGARPAPMPAGEKAPAAAPQAPAANPPPPTSGEDPPRP